MSKLKVGTLKEYFDADAKISAVHTIVLISNVLRKQFRFPWRNWKSFRECSSSSGAVMQWNVKCNFDKWSRHFFAASSSFRANKFKVVAAAAAAIPQWGKWGEKVNFLEATTIFTFKWFFSTTALRTKLPLSYTKANSFGRKKLPAKQLVYLFFMALQRKFVKTWF